MTLSMQALRYFGNSSVTVAAMLPSVRARDRSSAGMSQKGVAASARGSFGKSFDAYVEKRYRFRPAVMYPVPSPIVTVKTSVGAFLKSSPAIRTGKTVSPSSMTRTPSTTQVTEVFRSVASRRTAVSTVAGRHRIPVREVIVLLGLTVRSAICQLFMNSCFVISSFIPGLLPR